MAIFESPHPLNHTIWNALSSTHSDFAEGYSLAKRYPRDVSPLAAVRDMTPESFIALRDLLRDSETSVLFLQERPAVPDGFEIVACIPMEQMVSIAPPPANANAHLIEKLTTADVPEMLELTALTEPGPFRTRTIEFGGYIGIRDGKRLVAMAGQRLSLTGFTEISAVCTHPDYRGRGYAQMLVSAVTEFIYARGETPFLGVRDNNAGAIHVYENVGFRIRQKQYVTHLKKV